jgi:hypothetical protein
MQRPGAEMGLFAVNTRAETAGIREFGGHVFEIAALSRASLRRYNLRVWVVGPVWTELPTPHAVIEPISDSVGALKTQPFGEFSLDGGRASTLSLSTLRFPLKIMECCTDKAANRHRAPKEIALRVRAASLGQCGKL